MLGLLTLPIKAPVGGIAWIARQVAEAALKQWLDPARIEAAMLALEKRLEAGEIAEAEFEAQEAALLAELRQIRAERQAREGA
ncbi:gas vesicle protein GvpG [Paracraurococcus ruber]|uniref:Gas vesicle protein n=1 Tax=Paracraurococcus ruber TaxID=77675 RepID=A0ABS1D6K8_9PROT|nr:gas vesicle protein GvpG [Paracraurococcus ruber]MBK1661882.1 gas vesicle protein [Paracraurococcus ruber]TDG22997.1 gas vesicle protein [Paracraurococcus ruber]